VLLAQWRNSSRTTAHVARSNLVPGVQSNRLLNPRNFKL
jgi:hypothetical protein